MGGQPAPALRRVLSRWDLLAYGVNQVTGGAIFLMPAAIAAEIGYWSPFGFIAAGLASLASALCFAELGSRFEGTGGSYLYIRAAYGRFAAFEIAWIQWFVRVSGQASIVIGITVALGFYWPAMRTGVPRAVFILTLTLLLGYVNARGIRQSAWLIDGLTIGKLVPLGIFMAIGVFHADWGRLTALPPLSAGHALTAALLLAFTFGGYDTISVPAGEALRPRRDLPFAFIATIGVVTVIMALIQAIVVTTLGDATRSSTPLADAASVFIGPWGAAMIGAAAVLAMIGNNAGNVVTGSRLLFALAEQGELPGALARIHPVYRTPANAIWFTTGVALFLALSGSFTLLAAASAVARLVTYGGVAAATLTLRQPRFLGRVPAPTFVVPFGATVPAISCFLSLIFLAGATGLQLLVGFGAMLSGTLLFFLNGRMRPAAEVPVEK